jgi:hypothetical protein
MSVRAANSLHSQPAAGGPRRDPKTQSSQATSLGAAEFGEMTTTCAAPLDRPPLLRDDLRNVVLLGFCETRRQTVQTRECGRSVGGRIPYLGGVRLGQPVGFPLSEPSLALAVWPVCEPRV